MTAHQGGCLCGAIRYEVREAPLRVNFCRCRFCQRSTGAAFAVLAVFAPGAFAVLEGAPKVRSHRSGGSGKLVHMHFCEACGTMLHLTFERWDMTGVHAGTLDDPGWIEITPQTARHIFAGTARRGVVLPAGFDVFEGHALSNDGAPLVPVRFAAPKTVGG